MTLTFIKGVTTASILVPSTVIVLPPLQMDKHSSLKELNIFQIFPIIFSTISNYFFRSGKHLHLDLSI